MDTVEVYDKATGFNGTIPEPPPPPPPPPDTVTDRLDALEADRDRLKQALGQYLN
jgi:hypothetical protein